MEEIKNEVKFVENNPNPARLLEWLKHTHFQLEGKDYEDIEEI